MNVAMVVSWISWLVQRLPAPLLAGLDAWSRNVARRRAERRRQLAADRAAARPAAQGESR